ncbi:MAG TPA: PilZ domain-containing protein [Myxococcota bacterium]|nr:PilZ domain-containing protein [Myxococcota bacterium]
MSAGATRNLDRDEEPGREAPRDPLVQVVEYSRYPRRSVGELGRIAYTQDRSRSGLGLDLPEPVDPGELLQIRVRGIDGAITLHGLARVVWCEPADQGRARAGIAMLRERDAQPMRRVRKVGPSHTTGSRSSGQR